MSKRIVAAGVFLLLTASSMAVAAPTINPDLLSSIWPARWASHPDAGESFGVYHFRRKFHLESRPPSFVIHVSGDNRFELFVNGTRVARGPARGDLGHWRFETVDVAPHLHPGLNVLAAVVWNFADLAPMAQISHRTAFLVQGDSEKEVLVNTPEGWRVSPNPAYSPVLRSEIVVPFYFVVGPGERVDGSKYPWGWQLENFEDSDWTDAAVVSRAGTRGIRDSPSYWWLVPNRLPPMAQLTERLGRVARVEGTELPEGFLAGTSSLRVPANSRALLLLDQGRLTTAYPEVTVSGGRGSRIRVTYAEALWLRRQGQFPGQWEKGNRDDVEGKEMLGLVDEFRPDGGNDRLFRPLWWRTYRYLQLEIETAGQPLTVQDVKGVFTAYPFEEKARFTSSDPSLSDLWEIGWRTARLCAHETYMDCPYYEQLQYAGDTRIQALVSLYVSGDDRLVRNALEQIDHSRFSDGLTQSRYPSDLPQIIPPFSLVWVEMLHDYWMMREDPAFVRSFLPGIRGVLGWFELHLGATGLLSRLPWWNFVDWAEPWEDGIPPLGDGEDSSIITLQFISALRSGANLEESLGSVAQAQRWRSRADQLAQVLMRTCWDSTRGLLADNSLRQHFSQHANILAVLQAVTPKGEASRQEVLRRVLEDKSLTQATFYFRFFLGRALLSAGMGDLYLDQLGPWREMVRRGLTTWAEKPDPVRSDCHAWSASPNYELLATVAGIEPASPGFRSVRVRPHLGSLDWVKAELPHPDGMIRIDVRREQGRLVGNVELPGSVGGVFESGGKRRQLKPGISEINSPAEK